MRTQPYIPKYSPFAPWPEDEAVRGAQIASERYAAWKEELPPRRRKDLLCKACEHPDRLKIDRDLLMGHPPTKVARDVAENYNYVSCLNHRNAHLLGTLAGIMPEMRERQMRETWLAPYEFTEDPQKRRDWHLVQYLAIREFTVSLMDRPKVAIQGARLMITCLGKIWDLEQVVWGKAENHAPRRLEAPPATNTDHDKNLEQFLAKAQPPPKEYEDAETVAEGE